MAYTDKQKLAIDFICGELGIEYPYQYRNNFYDASEFIKKYLSIAQAHKAKRQFNK